MSAEARDSDSEAKHASPVASSDYERTVRAHAGYYAGLLAAISPRLKGAGVPDRGHAQLQALRLLALEKDNLPRALDTALDRDVLEWLLPFAVHLKDYFDAISAFIHMREAYSRLVSVARRLGSPRLRMEAEHGLGRAQARLGDVKRSLLSCEAARGLARQLEDGNAEANCISTLALATLLLSDYADASELFNQALVIRRRLGDRHGEAVALHNLANIESAQANYGAARELFKEILAIHYSQGDRLGEASVLNSLGNTEHQQGNYSAARELLKQSLIIQRELGDRLGEASCLNNIGNAEFELRNYELALELFIEALGIRRSLGTRHGEAQSLASLGNVEYIRERYAEAKELYEQSLAIRRSLGERRGEAFSLSRLAVAEGMLGNHSTARGLHGQALALRRGLGDRHSEANSLSSLANAEYILADYHAASGHAARALTFLHGLGDRDGVVVACAICGAVLAALGFLRPAAVVLHGAQACAAGLDYQFEPEDRPVIESGLAQIKAAATSGRIRPDELEQWKAQGEALSLDELAEFTLAALAEGSDGADADA